MYIHIVITPRSLTPWSLTSKEIRNILLQLFLQMIEAICTQEYFH